MPSISNCGKYRYRLDREVSATSSLTYAYFGVNPSTADATNNDQTIKRLISFCALHGGGKLIVANVFAYRATNVKELSFIEDPKGPENPKFIDEIIKEADILIPCWGNRDKLRAGLRPSLDEMSEFLVASGKPIRCLGKTKAGDPAHPLMLPKDFVLQPY